MPHVVSGQVLETGWSFPWPLLIWGEMMRDTQNRSAVARIVWLILWAFLEIGIQAADLQSDRSRRSTKIPAPYIVLLDSPYNQSCSGTLRTRTIYTLSGHSLVTIAGRWHIIETKAFDGWRDMLGYNTVLAQHHVMRGLFWTSTRVYTSPGDLSP